MVDHSKSPQKLKTCVIFLDFNKIDAQNALINSLYSEIGEEKIIVASDDADGQQDNWPRIHLHQVGKGGKIGARLISAMKFAESLGFTHAIAVIEQRYISLEDITTMYIATEKTPESILIGYPSDKTNFTERGRTYSDERSSLLFKMQTGEKIPKLNSQLRVYPLHEINRLKLRLTGLELNTEILIKACWYNIGLLPVKFEHSTKAHFDSLSKSLAHRTRIVILNAYLLLLAIFYFIPKRLFFKEGLIPTIKAEIGKNERIPLKAASIGFGLMMSVTPIWGFQSIIGLPIAILFRMNKVLFLLFVNISVPPLIPFIIYASFLLGSPFVVGNSLQGSNVNDFTMETIQLNFLQYAYGSTILAIIWGGLGFLISYFILSLTKSDKR